MNFTSLIFDMDGVIIDSEVLFDNADTEFFRRYGHIYNREEIALLLTGMHLKSGTALLKEKVVKLLIQFEWIKVRTSIKRVQAFLYFDPSDSAVCHRKH